MRKLLPILLALIGLGGGVGAGLALKPAPEMTEMPAEGGTEGHPVAAAAPAPAPAAAASDLEFVKLNNQFVVPVVSDGRVSSLVVMSVSLQVGTGGRETVFAREPKLRDGFLQVLFEHANAGGFNGSFTTSENLRTLRRALLESAQSILGEIVSDILIMDIMRQDT